MLKFVQNMALYMCLVCPLKLESFKDITVCTKVACPLRLIEFKTMNMVFSK